MRVFSAPYTENRPGGIVLAKRIWWRPLLPWKSRAVPIDYCIWKNEFCTQKYSSVQCRRM